MALRKTQNVILLPIYPQYANAILAGRKKVEFRKPYVPDAQYVVIYATSPLKQIVGYFEVRSVHRKCPKSLWDEFGSVGEIDRTDFFEYFSGSTQGAAFEIAASWKFQKPVSMTEMRSASPPQGFRYVDPDCWMRLSTFATVSGRFSIVDSVDYDVALRSSNYLARPLDYRNFDAAMKNPPDALKQYVALRDAIFAERETLITRLREMDEALGAMGLRGKDSYYGPRTPTGRVRNEVSLKEARARWAKVKAQGGSTLSSSGNEKDNRRKKRTMSPAARAKIAAAAKARWARVRAQKG